MALETKMEALRAALRSLDGAVVAYSGGADSAFVAEMAHQVMGNSSVAVTADSPSLPRRELQAAAALAAERGWRHEVVPTFELADARYRANPSDRCYFCKASLMERLGPIAAGLGSPVLFGTNVDDLSDWRPGQRAIDEAGGRHPLVEAGFTKAEVRAASADLGLKSAGKPASACLASRLAYSVPVTRRALARVEEAERCLLDDGFQVVRVRDLGRDRARIEVGAEEVPRLLGARDWAERTLHALGFREVVIDEQGYRRGALNAGLVQAGGA